MVGNQLLPPVLQRNLGAPKRKYLPPSFSQDLIYGWGLALRKGNGQASIFWVMRMVWRGSGCRLFIMHPTKTRHAVNRFLWWSPRCGNSICVINHLLHLVMKNTCIVWTVPIRNKLKSAQWIPSSKLTWQWKMDFLKMYSLLKIGIFHCHVTLPECTCCRCRESNPCQSFSRCFLAVKNHVRNNYNMRFETRFAESRVNQNPKLH